MQDFTGVPAIVDLAAMRDAMEELGGDPKQINPLVPVELVIDHSIQVDVFGEPLAFQRNAELEFERNRERYAFLRWGQTAFDNFASCRRTPASATRSTSSTWRASSQARDGQAFPDTLVGTDSHTTMINGLGVLGWGVGGIEAEAAMLGQPVSMLIPAGRRLPADRRAAGGRDRHRPRPDRHADAARARGGRQVRRVLRPGLAEPAAGRPRDDRQHVAGVRRDVRDLPGRRARRCATSSSPAARPSRWSSSRPTPRAGPVPRGRRRGRRVLRHARARPATVEPSLAGPARPQDRVALTDAAQDFRAELATSSAARAISRAGTSRRR